MQTADIQSKRVVAQEPIGKVQVDEKASNKESVATAPASKRSEKVEDAVKEVVEETQRLTIEEEKKPADDTLGSKKVEAIQPEKTDAQPA